MLQMLQMLRMWFSVTLLRDEEGQGFVEYAFLIVFIALLVIAGLTLLAGGVNGLFSAIGAALLANKPT